MKRIVVWFPTDSDDRQTLLDTGAQTCQFCFGFVGVFFVLFVSCLIPKSKELHCDQADAEKRTVIVGSHSLRSFSFSSVNRILSNEPISQGIGSGYLTKTRRPCTS